MPDEHSRAGDEAVVEVDGVVVAPPVTEAQGRSLLAAGLLADNSEGLSRCWQRAIEMWDRTAAGRALEPGIARRRVDGEWSLLETLRHLVMVSDTWVGMGVVGVEDMHPLGLPPHFMPPDHRFTVDADPTVAEVLAIRRERQLMVAEAIASVDDLSQPCHGLLAEFSMLGAIQVVLSEEWAHHSFAVRDLLSQGIGSG